MRLLYVLILPFFLMANFCFAQQVKPTLPGSVKGLVKDTAHHYVLKTATISIYKLKDSSLINYQLSNVYGEFNIKNLPVGTPLKLEVSYVGYQILEKNFTIPAATNVFDFKELIMSNSNTNLKEVVIKIPPISMNGDTLEINPSAFKLDSNAVIEDVLRRTPGLTLWGDGTITVNGREIKSVFVDGKQFFGGDPAIALQNINKNAVQKIQVYNQKNEQNPLDSIMTMNVKLKANKKFGMFGKVSAGMSTAKHYEIDGNINVYDTKLQLGIVGASNDINKIANNATTLLANSKFKGVGANISYQPDFNASGITKPSSGGVVFQYDFKENPTYNKKSTLSANYFVQRRMFENNSISQSITTIGEGKQTFGNSNNFNTSERTSQKFDNRFDYSSRKGNFTFSQSLTKNTNEGNSESLTNSLDNDKKEVSNNVVRSLTNTQNTAYTFNTNFNKNQTFTSGKKSSILGGLVASYALAINDNTDQSSRVSDFKSLINATQNRKIARSYDNNDQNITQNLHFSLPGILAALFKTNYALSTYSLSFKNTLRLNHFKDNNHVEDLDTLTSSYKLNNYLTNNLVTNQIEELPEISLSKSFNKSLSNRYYKTLNLSVGAVQHFIVQDNRSTKDFQNIKRNYSSFLPKASIYFYHSQFGLKDDSFNFQYEKQLRAPVISQLAPLLDSINVYNLMLGNINLKAANVHSFSGYFNHNNTKNPNTFGYNVSLSATIHQNGFADSTFTDAQNRRTRYTINMDGQRTINWNSNLNKAYKTKVGEFQFRLNNSVGFNKLPSYNNGQANFSNSINLSNGLNVFYKYKDLLAVEIGTTYSSNRSKQLAFNTDYKTANYANRFSGSLNLTKKLTLGSNISYNRSTSNTTANINYALWNANVTYRFLKGNNVEFKFAALDLLRQNTSVINFASANYLSTGTQTVLQQYFMTSIAYYPRMFGKPVAKK